MSLEQLCLFLGIDYQCGDEIGGSLLFMILGFVSGFNLPYVLAS